MLVEIWLAFMVFVLSVLWYSKHRHSYWASKGIPTASHLPIIGNFHDGIVRKMWESFDNIYKSNQGSKLIGKYEGFTPVLIVCDPDILRDILVKESDHFVDRRTLLAEKGSLFNDMIFNKKGDEWKVLRSIMSPTFSSGKMKCMYPIVCKYADSLITSCFNDAAKDPNIDMVDKFGRFTMDTIASCAFGIESNSLTKEKSVFTQKAEALFSVSFIKLIKVFLMIMFPKVYNAIGLKEYKELEFFTDVVNMSIKAREEGHKKGDFLDLILETRDNDDSNSTTSAKTVLSNRMIVAQCVLFLGAGYDTTASTLTFASHLLAINPKEQQCLRQELQELVRQEGELTFQGVMQAKYLDACIQESLRIYSPCFVLNRMCTKPYQIPGSEIVLKNGDMVQIPIWSIHRDAQYWPEPLKFRPDRFMPENKSSIKRFTHMPFGLGPRHCLAMRFALMEVKIVLAKLVLAAELGVAKGHEEIQLGWHPFLVRPEKSKLLIKPLNED